MRDFSFAGSALFGGGQRQKPHKGTEAGRQEASRLRRGNLLSSSIPQNLLSNFNNAMADQSNKEQMIQRAIEAGESPEEIERYLRGY